MALDVTKNAVAVEDGQFFQQRLVTQQRQEGRSSFDFDRNRPAGAAAGAAVAAAIGGVKRERADGSQIRRDRTPWLYRWAPEPPRAVTWISDLVFPNKAFAEAYKADFPMLSDPTKETAKAYGVLNPRGTALRWTFYIDKQGKIAFIDTEVGKRVATSAEDMVTKLEELKVEVKR